jgi:hypothetical protein
LNQFFAKVLPGRNGSLGVLFKGKESDNTVKAMMLTFQSFRGFCNLTRRFKASDIEEGEDIGEERGAPPPKEKKRKKSDKKSKKKKKKKHHHKKRKVIKSEPIEDDDPVDAPRITPLRALLNKGILTRQDDSPPPPMIQEEPDEEGDPSDEGSVKRIRVYAASLFESDCNMFTTTYQLVSNTPYCDMISYYNESDKNTYLVHDPGHIDTEGHMLIREYFHRHNSIYKVPAPHEINLWTPFAIRFNHEKVQLLSGFGKVGKAAWDSGLKKECQKASIVWDHLYSVLCARNEESFRTLMTWMANAVQRPWEQCNLTINHQGPQGIGKSEVFPITNLIALLRRLVYGKTIFGITKKLSVH